MKKIKTTHLPEQAGPSRAKPGQAGPSRAKPGYAVLYKPLDMESLLKIVDEIRKKKCTIPAEPGAP
ncbi:MAG: hypothetical protein WCH85_10615 [Methanomicrobiales archaeon]